MKTLSRYTASTILLTTGLVFLALLGMDFFIELINEFNDLGKGDYDLIHALLCTLYKLPRDVYRLFPMIALLGALLGLGLMAQNRELIVMRAAGLSITQIARTVLSVSCVLVLMATVVGEWIGPKALHRAEQIKTLAKTNGQAVSTQNGVWLREGNRFFHIEQIYKRGHLTGVTRYEFDDDHQLIGVSRAETARYHRGEWKLQNVDFSQINENGVHTQHLPSLTWQLKLKPAILKVAQVEPEEMTLRHLYQVMQYKKNNRVEYADYAFPFWSRLFQPLASAVMMFIAIPFIFGPLRSVSMGLRLLAGVTVGFSFYILNQLVGPLSLVYQFPPIAAALLPTLFFATLGIWFARRL